MKQFFLYKKKYKLKTKTDKILWPSEELLPGSVCKNLNSIKYSTCIEKSFVKNNESSYNEEIIKYIMSEIDCDIFSKITIYK